MLVLYLDLAKNNFHQFLLSGFKMNDTINFEDNFLYIFSVYQTRIFHSKSVIFNLLCLVLTKSLFSTIFTLWFNRTQAK